MAINYENLRKVLFLVDGLYDDAKMIITDAPEKSIEDWCGKWNLYYHNNDYELCNSYHSLKSEYYVKEIDVSDEEFYDELINAIGVDEVYDYSLYVRYEEEQENKKESQFTDDEMYILSDGLLALIRSTNEALKLTYDKKSIETLQATVQKYQELNAKVCSYIK